jgi:uncharacterized protein (TIGR02646 family)
VIRIDKAASVPEKLAKDGKRKRRSHCSDYTRNSDAYKAGDKQFNFDSNIYAHETVKQALISAQHKKCCFCERLVGTDGDVEHFRPKGAYKQSAGNPLERPGYYWLAYEWDNLYLSCAACNQRHKQNLFPLLNPADRATNHKQNINREQPLFINPGKDNPEDFIGFRAEMAYAIDGTTKGQTTIDLLRLNMRSLPEARLQRLQILRVLQQIVDLAHHQPTNIALQTEAAEAAKLLKDAVADSAEFAAAARWAIRQNFQGVDL